MVQMHGTFYVVKTVGTEGPVPSVPTGNKLTFPVYKNILFDIKDMREK